MIKLITSAFLGTALLIGGWFGLSHNGSIPLRPKPPLPMQATTTAVENRNKLPQFATTTKAAVKNQTSTTAASSTSSGGTYLTDAEVLALADSKYADGSVPLGDYKYTTDAPKKGYVYLCNARKDNPGSMVNGTWMHGTTWNFLEKVSVDGTVSWPNATFSNIISGSNRVLAGNALPINHTTGVFPVSSSDDAYQFDRNPNTITSQSLKSTLPVSPTYLDNPQCMGGEVGVMLSGVPLFNAFDAGLRDAPAHELQDSCSGHPQGSGEYHYHSLSQCFKDISVKTVLGYAYDGFPITGPYVAEGKYLTSEDLDVCHGITSEIIVDGKKKITYHYVMTVDFPYSASCFRGKANTGPSVSGGAMQGGAQQTSGMQSTPTSGQSGPQGGTPPQEAISACTGKSQGSSCSFSTLQGDTISGRCDTPPGSSLACVPNR